MIPGCREHDRGIMGSTFSSGVPLGSTAQVVITVNHCRHLSQQFISPDSKIWSLRPGCWQGWILKRLNPLTSRLLGFFFFLLCMSHSLFPTRVQTGLGYSPPVLISSFQMNDFFKVTHLPKEVSGLTYKLGKRVCNLVRNISYVQTTVWQFE